MEVVATAAKIATTAAPAAVEGAAVAANVVSAATETLQAATAATEAVQGGVKAVEVTTTAVEVAPEAMQAAENIDSALHAGTAAPEAAMNELAATPVSEMVTEIKEGGPVVEAITEDAGLLAHNQEEIQRAILPHMTDWEKSNPPGDDIQGWIERRAAAERQFTLNEEVNRDLAEWKNKEENLPPDKEQNPKEYAAWEERLAVKERQSRQTNEASYDQLPREQEQKKQEMSKEEFMRRYAELLQLRVVADQLAMRLQKLRASTHQTRMRGEVLARGESQLNTMRADIATREADLQFDAIYSGSIFKQFIIPAAVGAAVAAGQIEAANEV